MHHEEVRRDLDLVVLEMGLQIEPTQALLKPEYNIPIPASGHRASPGIWGRDRDASDSL